MSKFKIKLAKRIMAVVLSGAMVMSNMSAYAAELAPETTTEVVSESEESTTKSAGEETVSDAREENAETGNSAVKDGEGGDGGNQDEESAPNEESKASDESNADEESNASDESNADGESKASDESNADGESNASDESNADEESELDAPANVAAALNDTKDGVVVTWDSVKDATSYVITAAEQDTETTTEITKTVDATPNAESEEITFGISEDDEKRLTRGKSYKFSVTAKKDGVSSEPTEATDVITIPESTTKPVETVTHAMESSELTQEATKGNLIKVDESGKSRNGEKAGKDDYFTMWYSQDSRINTSAKAWADYNNTLGDDGKVPTINRIDFGKKMAVTSDKVENAIEFTTQNPAKVTVWWAANYAGIDGAAKFRDIAIQTADGTTVTQTHLGAVTEKNAAYKSTLRLSEAGTYYLGSLVGGNYLFKVEVEEGETGIPRKAWGEVGTPVITAELKTKTVTDEEGNETVETDNTIIVVKVTNAVLEDNGGDVLTVTMTKDGSEEALETKKDAVSRTEYTYEFSPKESAKYNFKAELSRLNDKGEEESGKKESSVVSFDFTMPFLSPANLSTTVTDGNDDPVSVEVKWDPVVGAEKYSMTITEKDAAEGTEPIYTNDALTETTVTVTEGLVRGKMYTVSVIAVRGTGESEEKTEPATADFKIKEIVTPPAGELTTTTYDFVAAEYMVNDADEAVVDAGTKFGTDNYYKAVVLGKFGNPAAEGFIKKRGTAPSADKAGKTKALLISQEASAGIQFTVQGTADATFKVSSTGGSNDSVVALLDADGLIVQTSELTLSKDSAGKQADGSVSVHGNETTPSVLVYKGLSKGTYTLISAKDFTARGAWLVSASVSDSYEAGAVAKTTVLDAAKIYTENKVAGTWKDGETESYVNNYFTVIYSAASKVEAKSYSKPTEIWEDGYTGGYRISFGGTASKEKNAIKFTTTQDEATIKLWWKAGGDGRHVQLLNENGTPIEVSKETSTANTSYITKFKLTQSGTYYIGNDTGNNYLFKLSVTEGHVEEPIDWSEVQAPKILSAEQTKDAEGKLTGTVEVKVEAVIHEIKGCEKLTVEMYDTPDATEPIDKATSAVQSETGATLSFTPPASGTYYFVAKASRASETTTKDSERYAMQTAFILPLSAPNMGAVTNLGKNAETGKGSVEAEWTTAKEATGYIVRAFSDKECTQSVAESTTSCVFEEDGSTIKEAAPTSAIIDGLEIGQTYYIAVAAVRGEEQTAFSAPIEKKISEEKQSKWAFAAYGSSTSITSTTKDKDLNTIPKNGYSGDFYDGEVTVWSMGGAGKVVPDTIDGLAFYYTEINPKTTNFTLKATAHVNEWSLSNGQDGFGLMASDQVGENGNGDYLWTNSYQAVVSKIEYNWDGEKVTTDTTKPKIAMKIGVGATEKVGATKEDVEQITAGKITKPVVWSATQSPLDTTYAKYAKAGATTTCNMVGGAQGAWDSKKGEWVANPAPSEATELYEDFELTLRKNNTGYFLSFKMPNGETMTKKYYDPTALDHIIEDKVYVGFFAARNANITFKDIEFTTIAPEDDDPVETQPPTYVALSKSIASPSVTNTSDYDLVFTSNWSGKLEVRDSNNKIAGTADVIGSLDTEKAAYKDGDNEKDTKAHVELSGLEVGNNVYTLTFTPDKDMKNKPALTELINYDPVTLTLTVEYRKYGQENSIIYVSPDGRSSNTGTEHEPLDIYTAIKYAQPGQTILLEGGRYNLYKSLKTETSGEPDVVDGKETYKKYIKMIAKDMENRPIIDFNEAVTGMTMIGSYWYFKGFDVTRSADGQKGVQVSGSYNVLDQINTYYNGNTGIQVSRNSGADTYQSWPQHNLILNCTSFLNSDHGYEDADGFAAKLTIGSGNVFDGCIAAYNADDGWDLFAKIQSGQIGAVTIQNCVAYRNGYVLKNSEGKLDIAGELTNAGNGNGFKMGGDGLPGGSIYDEDYDAVNNVYSGHKLKNSVAFENKAKGFDSNSCSNNKISNSISFNNENSNVALYSYTSTKVTGYETQNVISYRTKDTGVSDEISAKSQDKSDYENSTTYLWDGAKQQAVNSDGKAVEAGWFESLEFKAGKTPYNDVNGILLGRNSNGTIDMQGFLVLKESAGQGNAGLGSGQDSVSNDKLTAGSEVTDGSVSSGDVTITDDTASSEIAKEENEVSSELSKDMNYGIYVKYLEEVSYTGTPVKPEFRVYLNGVAFTDYKVTYKNNVNAYEEGNKKYENVPDAKRPTLVLTLKGSYQGTYEYYFDIKPVDISTVSVSGLSGLADGKAKKVAPTLIYNGKKLSAGKDYTITTAEPQYKLKGEYPVKIDAAECKSGNFTGTLETKFILLDPADAKDISKTQMKLKVSAFEYIGSELKPVPDGYDPATMDISWINNTDVGKATITITGKPEQKTVGSKTISFTIKKAALKDQVNVFVENLPVDTPYTGSALSPAKITVKTVNTIDQTEKTVLGVKKGSKDVNEKVGGFYKYGYTYQYKANTEAGNATLTVTGIHNYSGSVSYKFKITPKSVEEKDISQIEAVGRYKFTNKNLEIAYTPAIEYTPNGTVPNIVIKYNGNTISKKNYSISYKNNKNATQGRDALATITWKGSLKGTPKTELKYKIDACSFESGNITAKSVTDVFTNGKPSIKLSELEKSKIVLVNVNKTLTKNRDYTLLYEYNKSVTSEDGNTVTTVTETYEPQKPEDKEKGKTLIDIPKETGLNVTVYAKPVEGGNFSAMKDANSKGLKVAEFRVAHYDIAKAKIQIVDKAIYESTGKMTTAKLYFVDDTETQKANLGALNRLNNYTTNANKEAPYYMMLTHPAMKEVNENGTTQLSFGSYENRDSVEQKNQYTYDYENTATTVAGKHSVTLYGTGMFGGTRVFKYDLIKKTYDLKKLIVDTKTVEAPVLDANASKEVNDAAIKAKLKGKLIINGNTLDTNYIKLSYDTSKIQSGSSLKITITGDKVNGIKVYSGFTTVSIKLQ